MRCLPGSVSLLKGLLVLCDLYGGGGVIQDGRLVDGAFTSFALLTLHRAAGLLWPLW